MLANYSINIYILDTYWKVVSKLLNKYTYWKVVSKLIKKYIPTGRLLAHYLINIYAANCTGMLLANNVKNIYILELNKIYTYWKVVSKLLNKYIRTGRLLANYLINIYILEGCQQTT